MRRDKTSLIRRAIKHAKLALQTTAGKPAPVATLQMAAHYRPLVAVNAPATIKNYTCLRRRNFCVVRPHFAQKPQANATCWRLLAGYAADASSSDDEPSSGLARQNELSWLSLLFQLATQAQLNLFIVYLLFWMPLTKVALLCV